MSDVISDRVVARIRALLAKTVANGCTEAEAFAAQQKAHEVIAQHNLDLTQLEKAENTAGQTKREKALNARSAQYKWQPALMRSIAEANFCKYWLAEVKPEQLKGKWRSKPVKRHFLLGREVNVVSANMMYDYLVDTMNRLLPFQAHLNKSRDAFSWMTGCAERLIARIDEAHDDAMRKAKAEKKAAEAKARDAGIEVNAVMLIDVYGSEDDLNEDAYWGYPAGTIARERAEFRAKIAARTPEPPPPPKTAAEIAAEEAEMAKYRAKWKRRDESAERKRQAERARLNLNFYEQGASTADKISLNKQIDEDVKKRIT